MGRLPLDPAGSSWVLRSAPLGHVVRCRLAAGRPSGRLTLHSLRHGFASLLIANGIVFVSRQLGHASPATTLRVYAHLYARHEHGERARAALETAHAAMSRARHGFGLAAIPSVRTSRTTQPVIEE